MSWIIRRMADGDIDAVLAFAETIPEAPHWNLEEYGRCVGLDESGPLLRAGFVAEAEGGLLGFSVGKLVAGVCELESIAVAQENRGQGIGRALLQTLADWALVKGAARIELEVRASNARAIKLYEQAGLQREGLRPAYYRSPEEDAVLMGKVLLPGGKLP
ncbi:MAG TPA: ribosomal protein S18-alanine N-acetyltransferase [Alloacidobacterium sp.]|nr:ribosomal protein S18-alanine N-acetyltransferase [Alloacidobacterium sp.]